jgi:short-subunit dehydrogenase
MRKTALITGASAGIGLELARLFARHHNDLVLVARRGERLREIAAELEGKHGITAHVIVADLAAVDGPHRLFGEVQERGIEIEYLVNNAGFGTFGAFSETDVQSTMDLVRLNIGALTELTALLLPAMIERNSGRVLNVASAAAFQPGPLMATYYASKAYGLHFSEALNEELEGKAVSVTALCPGPVRTEFQQVAGMETSGLVLNKRLTSVEEVAEAGYRAMMRGKAYVIPGLASKLLALSVRFAPRRFVAKFVHRLQADRTP